MTEVRWWHPLSHSPNNSGVYHPTGCGYKEMKKMWYLYFTCKIPSLSLGYRTTSLLEVNRGKVNPRAAQHWNFLAKISRCPKQQSAMLNWLLGPRSANVVCVWCVCSFSRYLVSDSLRPHGLQEARLPCPSLSPGVCSNSCPLIQWYYLVQVYWTEKTYSPPLRMNTFQNPWTWVCRLSCSSKFIGQQTCIMLSSYYAN